MDCWHDELSWTVQARSWLQVAGSRGDRTSPPRQHCWLYSAPGAKVGGFKRSLGSAALCGTGASAISRRLHVRLKTSHCPMCALPDVVASRDSRCMNFIARSFRPSASARASSSAHRALVRRPAGDRKRTARLMGPARSLGPARRFGPSPALCKVSSRSHQGSVGHGRSRQAGKPAWGPPRQSWGPSG